MSDPAPDAMRGVTIVKELADAVSMQARVSNRMWIVTMSASLLVLLPRSVSSTSPAQDITLPFQIGAVDPAAFYPVAFAMLSVLLVAFCSAHAQQVRAQKLAQGVLDSLRGTINLPPGISMRELFDMFRMPSVTRVAPLAQLLRGKYQFHDQAPNCPTWLRIASAVFYLVLKLVAAAVYFVLPGLALWYSFVKTTAVSLATWMFVLLAAMGFVAAFSLLEVIVTDLLYNYHIAVRILGKPAVTA